MSWKGHTRIITVQFLALYMRLRVLSALELWQAWGHDYFPGGPVPVASHPLGEELFPYIQPKPALTKLHAVFLILSLVTRVKSW